MSRVLDKFQMKKSVIVTLNLQLNTEYNCLISGTFGYKRIGIFLMYTAVVMCEMCWIFF